MGKDNNQQSSKKEFVQRLISALIVAPFVLLCFVSYSSLVGLVATIVMIGTSELFFTVVKKHGMSLVVMYTAVVTLYPVLYGVAFRNNPMELLATLYIAGSIVTLAKVKDKEAITEVHFAYATALIYVSFLLSFFLPIYDLYGAAIALLTLTLSWAYDSFAYAFGVSTGGKHKLHSYYSPNKSWEGLFGGIFGTFLYILLYQNLANLFFNANMQFSLPFTIFLSIVTGIFDTFGDLFESSIKRHYGVKHLGNLMPGHGGILDRIDGLLFITPIVYIILQIFY
ncbi:MAG: phosphatidate cytidylyltransferase [Thermotogaceae bacterium]|nr:phosphatidate cytidylyltransferase [Thermotogaceae bacterium]